MSFRIEEKFRVDKSKLFEFKDWLLSKGGKKLFEKRKISSIYFDNNNFQMHNDSVEGILPRHKIRLRFYNDNKNEVNLEKKISSVEGRFKNSYKIYKFKECLKYGFFDKNYGICKPTTEVTYFRDYYSLDGQRITIDSSIKYKKAKLEESNFMYCDDKIIVELKNNNLKYNITSDNKFDFERIRFSKYCRSVGMVYKLSY